MSGWVNRRLRRVAQGFRGILRSPRRPEQDPHRDHGHWQVVGGIIFAGEAEPGTSRGKCRKNTWTNLVI